MLVFKDAGYRVPGDGVQARTSRSSLFVQGRHSGQSVASSLFYDTHKCLMVPGIGSLILAIEMQKKVVE
jgi:hypothetical protein